MLTPDSLLSSDVARLHQAYDVDVVGAIVATQVCVLALHTSAAILRAPCGGLPSSRRPVSEAQEGPSSGLTSLLPAGNEHRQSRRERLRPGLQAGGELGDDVRG